MQKLQRSRDSSKPCPRPSAVNGTDHLNLIDDSNIKRSIEICHFYCTCNMTSVFIENSLLAGDEVTGNPFVAQFLVYFMSQQSQRTTIDSTRCYRIEYKQLSSVMIHRVSSKRIRNRKPSDSRCNAVNVFPLLVGPTWTIIFRFIFLAN